jgi:(p)ppGpp synthase/HD superfamily hydrolase
MNPAERSQRIEQNMKDVSDISHATGFCQAAHSGQKRKFSGIPYWTHPMDVADLLHDHGHSDVHTQVVALLHDVVEDTHVTLDEIKEHFGEAVAEDVKWLTKRDYSGQTDPSGKPLNRAEKKVLECYRLKLAPAHVKTIKLADRLHNMTLLTEDPEFAPVFARETRRLLDVALEGGCPVLWAKLDKIVQEFLDRTT